MARGSKSNKAFNPRPSASSPPDASDDPGLYYPYPDIPESLSGPSPRRQVLIPPSEDPLHNVGILPLEVPRRVDPSLPPARQVARLESRSVEHRPRRLVRQVLPAALLRSPQVIISKSIRKLERKVTPRLITAVTPTLDMVRRCVTRFVRREVVFARRKAGKGRTSRKRRVFNLSSHYRCR